jgi:hypothetical protein
MKKKALGVGAIVALVILCFGLPALAQDDVSVQFTGGYSTTWSNSGGDYDAGIFTAKINGKSSHGIVSDDFNNEITSGETWGASAIQASSLTSSNIGETLFGNTIGITGYAEVATLVSMMFNDRTSYHGITGITQAELSSAIWDITTTGGISGLDANAQALVAAVEAAYKGDSSKAQAYLAKLTNLWILTPTSQGPGEAPEFWTKGLAVPEGGTPLLYLLLAGISCFGALLFNNKDRVGRGISA